MATETPSGGNIATRTVRAVDEFLRSAGSRLAATSPWIGRALSPARESYVRAFLWAVAVRNRLRYRAPPEPSRLIGVDPAEIGGVVEFPVSKFRLNGVVRCGDWDRDRRPFEELDIYRSFRRHFEDGVPWDETAFFDRVLADIERGLEPWGCDSRAAFETRCSRLDDLYASIATDGFRTQAELLAAADETNPFAETSIATAKRLRDDIAVHIGRNGELLFEDGRNRLSMAKLLDIDAIPVRVLLRHCDWQETREAYVRGEIDESSDLADHPDLRPLSIQRS